MNSMNYYLFKAILIFFSLPLVISEKIPQSKVLPIIPDYMDSLYSSPKAVGKLSNKEIDEASGIAFSRTHEDIIYTHNDSGGKPYIYMIDTYGGEKGKIILEGVKNRDWEDIAVGPGPNPNLHYIYVGDIGDNRGVYPEIFIHRLAEPKPFTSELRIKPKTLKLTYPDGPKDAETLMVDPVSKDIFILSKRDSANILYRVPTTAFEKDEYVLEKVMELPFTMSVAGDISFDGTQILIKNYLTVFFWERKAGESIPEALSRDPLILPYKPEPQGEAIAFHPSGRSYFTLSEQRFNIRPVLYRYNKK